MTWRVVTKEGLRKDWLSIGYPGQPITRIVTAIAIFIVQINIITNF